MDERIKKALEESLFREVAEREAEFAVLPPHDFSSEQERRIRECLPVTERKYVVFRRKAIRRSAWIAAVMALLLSASAVVFALAAPQIHYLIEKGGASWDIFFQQEDPDGLMPEEFHYIEPLTPNGYVITDKDESPGVFSLVLENAKDQRIIYSQIESDIVGVTLDAEGDYIEERFINDHKCIVRSDGDSYSLLFDNGYYVFLIEGNCELSVLEKMGEEIINQL